MSERLIREFVRAHLLEQVRRKFQMELPDDLLRLASDFKAAGHLLYVVGGSVRDALQGKEPKDYDVATDAVPDKVIQICQQEPGMKILEIGKSFGIVKVVTPQGNEYEIATFRQDIGKGRRPDAVEFTDIENDVKRRDLTINALFYDIDAGEIVDYVGGIEDIENGVVRAVGDPKERFDEDRLRILRALRFAARMGSDLDPATSEAISEDNSLAGVSPERIRDEFLKGVKSAASVPYFLGLIEKYDLWPQVLHGLRVSQHSFEARDPAVLLALLLDQNDPALVAKKLNALKYTSTEAAQASFLVRLKGLTPDNAFRLKKLANQSKVSSEQMYDYAEESFSVDTRLLDAFTNYQPTVSGNDPELAGFTGASMGKEIERLETERFKELTGA